MSFSYLTYSCVIKGDLILTIILRLKTNHLICLLIDIIFLKNRMIKNRLTILLEFFCYLDQQGDNSYSVVKQYIHQLIPIFFLLQVNEQVNASAKFDLQILYPYLKLETIHEGIAICSFLFNLVLVGFLFISLHKAHTYGSDIFEKIINNDSIYSAYLLVAFANMMRNLNLCIHIPSLTLLLTATKHSLLNGSYWYLTTIPSIIMLQCLSLLQFYNGDTQLLISKKSHKKLNLTIVDATPYVTIIFQTYLYVLVDSASLDKFHAILYIFYIFATALCIYVYKTMLTFSLYIYSMGILLVILNLVELPGWNLITDILLLYPPLTVVIVKVYDMVMLNFKTHQKVNLIDVHLQLCYYLKAEPLNQLCLNVILAKHKRTCQSSKCQCHEYRNQQIIYDHQWDDIINYDFVDLLDVLHNFKNFLTDASIYEYSHYLQGLQFQGDYEKVYKLLDNQAYIKKLNYFSLIKFSVVMRLLKEKTVQGFLSKIERDSVEQQEIYQSVKAFMNSELQNQSIRNRLISLINTRILIFDTFHKDQLNDQFLNISETFINDLNIVEILLRKQYDEFPSSKNSSLLSLFYAEIYYDWDKAFRQSSLSTYTDLISKMTQMGYVNMLSNQMQYIIFNYQNKQLIIKKYSHNASQVFGYTQGQFKKFKTIDALLPTPIANVHSSFVEQFQQSGQASFFRNKDITLSVQKNGLLQIQYLLFDIVFDQENSLQYIAFVQQCNVEQGILLFADDQLFSFNEIFLNMLGYQNITFNIDRTLKLKNVLRVVKDITYFIFPKEDLSGMNCYEANCTLKVKNKYTLLTIFDLQKSHHSHEILLELKITRKSELFENEPILLPYDENGALSPFQEFQQFDTIQTTRTKNQLTKNLIPSIADKTDQLIETEKDAQTVRILGNVYQRMTQKSIQQNENASQASSWAGIRRSKFFRRYQLMSQMNENITNLHANSIGLIVGLLFVLIVILIIFFIVLLSYISEDFATIKQYSKSIQINHYFIEPIQKFFLTRLTNQSYTILGYYGLMNSSTQSFYSKFNTPNLINQYIVLKNQFNQNFQDPYLQEFIIDQYLQVRYQVIHKAPLKFVTLNQSVTSAFNYLLEANFQQYSEYVKKPITSTGTNPYNSFQYINYMLFVTFFDNIANEMILQSKTSIKSVAIRWLVTFIPFTVTVIIICLVLIRGFRNQIVEKIVAQKIHIEHFAIEQDLRRLNFLSKKLEENGELIDSYYFNIDNKEQMMSLVETVPRTQPSSTKIQTSQKSYNSKFRVTQLSTIIFISLILVFHCVTSQLLTQLGYHHLRKYDDTVDLMKSLSDIGVYIPAGFSQVEIIYAFSYFSYFGKSDLQAFMAQIEKAIMKIQQFLSISLDLSKRLQMSDTFMIYYANLQNSDLCKQLNPQLYVNFTYFCYKSHYGILQKGLYATLNQFQHDLSNEIANNFPESRISQENYLEAVYLSSEVITNATSLMQNDISNVNDSIQSQLTIISVVSLILAIIALSLLLKYKYYLTQRLHTHKRFVFLFPQETILLSQQFEREIRRIAILEQLI